MYGNSSAAVWATMPLKFVEPGKHQIESAAPRQVDHLLVAAKRASRKDGYPISFWSAP